MTIRVLLADDQALLRATFRLLVDATEDMEVVAEAADGQDAVTKAREAQADVVVMDVRMPGVDGIEATRRITADEDLAGVKILVLTTFETDEFVVAALRAGASGFLGKGVEPEALLQAIRTVAAGGVAAVAVGDHGVDRPVPGPAGSAAGRSAGGAG